MSLTQLSVFVENKQGSLVNITRALAENGVNIRALSIADTKDFGILRIIVNDTAHAFDVLGAEGYLVKATEVLGVTYKLGPYTKPSADVQSDPLAAFAEKLKKFEIN